MTFYYAQVKNERVISVLESSKEMENKPDNVIQIDSLDISLINKIYSNGQFLDPPPQPKTYSRLQIIEELGDIYTNIVTASKSDVETEIWLEKFRLTEFFDFSRQNDVDSIQFLVTKGFANQEKIDSLILP